MKGILNYLLIGIGAVGAILVGQGIITGEQLTSVQNIVGIAMAGGGFTALTVVKIITAIPKELVNAGYNKLVEKYGEEAVDGLMQTFKDILEAQVVLNDKIDSVIKTQEEDREARNNLLNM